MQASNHSQASEFMTEWRDASGVKMPFKILLRFDNGQTREAAVVSYEFNTGLKAEDLSKKP